MTHDEFSSWAAKYVTASVLQARYRITGLAVSETQLSAAIDAVGAAYFAPIYTDLVYTDELVMSSAMSVAIASFVFAYITQYRLTPTKYSTSKGTHEGSTVPSAEDISAQVSKYRRIGVMYMMMSDEAKEHGLTFSRWSYTPILGEEI